MAQGLDTQPRLSGRALPICLVGGALVASAAARLLLTALDANELGANRQQIGILYGAFMAGAALAAVPSGFLADRFGRRSILLLAIIAGGASQLAAATTTSFGLLLIFQAVGGVVNGCAQPALLAAITDAAPAQRVGRSVGWYMLSTQVGLMGGPAIASLGLSMLTLRTDLALTSGLYAIALPVTLIGIQGIPGRIRTLHFARTLRDLSRRHNLYAILLAVFAIGLVGGVVQAYLPILGKEVMLLSGTQIGYLLAWQGMISGVSRIPVGRLVDSLTRRGPLVFFSATGYCLATMLLPHLHGFWAPALVLALMAPMLGAIFIAIGVSLFSLAGDGSRGLVTGLYSMTVSSANGLGPAVFGPIVLSAGYRVGFAACGFTAVLLLAVSVGVTRLELRRRPLETAAAIRILPRDIVGGQP